MVVGTALYYWVIGMDWYWMILAVFLPRFSLGMRLEDIFEPPLTFGCLK